MRATGAVTAEVRELTIESSGGVNATAVWIVDATTSPSFRDVEVRVSGSGSFGIYSASSASVRIESSRFWMGLNSVGAVYLVDGSAVLRDVEIEGSPVGVWVQANGTSTTDLTIARTVVDANPVVEYFIDSGATINVRMVDSQIKVGLPPAPVGALWSCRNVHELQLSFQMNDDCSSL